MTDEQKTIHKVYLAGYEVLDLICAIGNRARAPGKTEDQRANCRKAVNWLNGLVRGKTQIQNIELPAPTVYLEKVAYTAIEDGLTAVGQSILQQIASAGE